MTKATRYQPLDECEQDCKVVRFLDKRLQKSGLAGRWNYIKGDAPNKLDERFSSLYDFACLVFKTIRLPIKEDGVYMVVGNIDGPEDQRIYRPVIGPDRALREVWRQVVEGESPGHEIMIFYVNATKLVAQHMEDPDQEPKSCIWHAGREGEEE